MNIQSDLNLMAKCNRIRGCRPEIEAKYRPALELYTTSDISCVEICRRCGVSLNGFSNYIGTYHRHLMLWRNGIRCTRKEAGRIRMNQRRGQKLRTHYPEILEFRERTRRKMGLSDNLPRGVRRWCLEQYAEAVDIAIAALRK